MAATSGIAEFPLHNRSEMQVIAQATPAVSGQQQQDTSPERPADTITIQDSGSSQGAVGARLSTLGTVIAAESSDVTLTAEISRVGQNEDLQSNIRDGSASASNEDGSLGPKAAE